METTPTVQPKSTTTTPDLLVIPISRMDPTPTSHSKSSTSTPLSSIPPTPPQPPKPTPPIPILLAIPPSNITTITTCLTRILHTHPTTTLYFLRHERDSPACTCFITTSATPTGLCTHDITHSPDIFYIHTPTPSSTREVHEAMRATGRYPAPVPKNLRLPDRGGVLGVQVLGRETANAATQREVIAVPGAGSLVLHRAGEDEEDDGGSVGIRTRARRVTFETLCGTHVLVGRVKVLLLEAAGDAWGGDGGQRLVFRTGGVGEGEVDAMETAVEEMGGVAGAFVEGLIG